MDIITDKYGGKCLGSHIKSVESVCWHFFFSVACPVIVILFSILFYVLFRYLNTLNKKIGMKVHTFVGSLQAARMTNIQTCGIDYEGNPTPQRLRNYI